MKVEALGCTVQRGGQMIANFESDRAAKKYAAHVNREHADGQVAQARKRWITGKTWRDRMSMARSRACAGSWRGHDEKA